MSYTVSQIASLFHNFHDRNDRQSEKTEFLVKKRGKALLFATVNHSAQKYIQKQAGIDAENAMLNLYEKKTGNIVSARNDKLYDIILNGLHIIGKVDGVVADKNILVEHKRRTKGILYRIPYHELVQCHFYMKMLNINTTHLVETFGTCMEIHEISFDEKIWKFIANTCSIKSNYFNILKENDNTDG